MTSRNREGGLGCGYLMYAAGAGALVGVAADFVFNARVTPESLINYGVFGAASGIIGGAIVMAVLGNEN